MKIYKKYYTQIFNSLFLFFTGNFFLSAHTLIFFFVKITENLWQGANRQGPRHRVFGFASAWASRSCFGASRLLFVLLGVLVLLLLLLAFLGLFWGGFLGASCSGWLLGGGVFFLGSCSCFFLFFCFCFCFCWLGTPAGGWGLSCSGLGLGLSAGGLSAGGGCSNPTNDFWFGGGWCCLAWAWAWGCSSRIRVTAAGGLFFLGLLLFRGGVPSSAGFFWVGCLVLLGALLLGSGLLLLVVLSCSGLLFLLLPFVLFCCFFCFAFFVVLVLSLWEWVLGGLTFVQGYAIMYSVVGVLLVGRCGPVAVVALVAPPLLGSWFLVVRLFTNFYAYVFFFFFFFFSCGPRCSVFFFPCLPWGPCLPLGCTP